MRKVVNSFKFKTLIKIFAVSFLMLVLIKDSDSQTVVLSATKDNTLYENTLGTLSNGAGQHFFSGRTATGFIRRGVIHFHLSEFIPPCAVVQSVTLKLHMSKTIAGPIDIGLQRLFENWGEGISDANGDEGGGAPSEPDDATWIHKFYDYDTWSSQGGTFSVTTSASVSVDQIGFYTWGTNSQMINDVQGWLVDPASNNGWILIGDEINNASTKRFDSRENDSVNFYPVLTVTYTSNNITLNLTSLIEGLWDGTSMVSDTAKVFLRSSIFPYAKIDSAKSVLDQYGSGTFCFNNAQTGQYYIVVTHRNSIDTWSKLPQSFTTGTPKNYDFTTAATQAFGDNMVLKGGKYCNYSGDTNKDGTVDVTDVVGIYNDAVNFVSGYVVTDLNGDQFVDVSDVLMSYNNAVNFVSVVTP